MKQAAMLDLSSEYQLYKEKIREAVDAVLESQHFIGGPAVSAFEERMCAELGVSHAVAVSSGTDALLCTLMALEIGQGDEVVLPAFSFFATAGSVARVGAKPVFVDIDARTFNIDPDQVAAAITPKTKAVMVVHLYGQCADMDPILTVASRAGIPVIEDAAQAVGATYKQRRAGTLGTAACLSFYPTKNLGGFGEGGMILTGDERLATIARQLRNHGESQRYVHERIGGNFRLDTMKAAILLVKLDYWARFTRQRRHNASVYDRLLGDAPVETPFGAPDREPVYHQYTIRCRRRDELATYLGDKQVATGIYYAVPLHLQKCFASLGYSIGSLPVTEEACECVLSLPCHPMLTDEQLAYVAASVKSFYDV